MATPLTYNKVNRDLIARSEKFLMKLFSTFHRCSLSHCKMRYYSRISIDLKDKPRPKAKYVLTMSMSMTMIWAEEGDIVGCAVGCTTATRVPRRAPHVTRPAARSAVRHHEHWAPRTSCRPGETRCGLSSITSAGENYHRLNWLTATLTVTGRRGPRGGRALPRSWTWSDLVVPSTALRVSAFGFAFVLTAAFSVTTANNRNNSE